MQNGRTSAVRPNSQTTYVAPLKDWAASTTMAFVAAGFALRDGQCRIPRHLLPFPSSPELSRGAQAMIARSNAEQTSVEERVTDEVTQFLCSVGIDARSASSREVKAFIATTAARERVLMAQIEPPLHRGETRALSSPSYRHELGVRAVIATRFLLANEDRQATDEEMLRFLNAGRRGDERSLTRHSLRSAWGTFKRWLRAESWDRVDKTARDVRTLAELRVLSEAAPSDARFRHLRGEALAFGIHEALDLNACLWNARKQLRKIASAQSVGQ